MFLFKAPFVFAQIYNYQKYAGLFANKLNTVRSLLSLLRTEFMQEL